MKILAFFLARIDKPGKPGYLTDKNASSVQTVTTTGVQHRDAWYTLDGRRIEGQPNAKGINIIGGKKVVVK